MKNHAYIIRLTFTALFAAIIMLATMIYRHTCWAPEEDI